MLHGVYSIRRTIESMNIFTYGTLMVAEIMAQVSGCSLSGVEATLNGFVRYGVKDEQYPGVIALPGSSVQGILYRDVQPDALARLDLFEGDLYHRRQVQVRCHDTTVLVPAMVYAIKPQYSHVLTGEPWDFQHFLRNGRELFESGYNGFAELQNR